MTVNLKNVKLQSQTTFSGVTETSDDTLYFVEANVVVSTYRNGTEWRRVWSDGWCEQGGQTNSINRNGTIAVPLGQPYSNSSYTIMVTAIGNYSSNNSASTTVTARGADSFSITNGSAVAQSFMWETKGYIN